MYRIRCYGCGAESYYDGKTRIFCPWCVEIMENRIKELEEGIMKHRDSPIIFRKGEGGEGYDSDEELYKLVEKEV